MSGVVQRADLGTPQLRAELFQESRVRLNLILDLDGKLGAEVASEKLAERFDLEFELFAHSRETAL